MKARVYREADRWVAEINHGSWSDSTPFVTWPAAPMHAQWLAHREAGRA
jgi:hypothetical protein